MLGVGAIGKFSLGQLDVVGLPSVVVQQLTPVRTFSKFTRGYGQRPTRRRIWK